MKLLFDENLSVRLVESLKTEFPNSTHPELLSMRGASDAQLWQIARDLHYLIVSKDNDFRQRSFLDGAPPKVIWLNVGNTNTQAISQLLRDRIDVIREFENAEEQSLLALSI